ncbi:radical SAM protein [Acidilutibacter cellobiosedens]|uniref:Radical SAM protein n=1 Tax=Acidilutibacter cellobiosedens TaxID=2507161 RepID=A0A410Q8X8_9FIRM|nr:radical SAM protein [Acidilutibacter cellobiosedens]QAT60445.1 radical SAM protein [Acidilutibacter cellobiosedens]
MSITLWITNKCNMNCKYCYVGDEKSNFSMPKLIIDKSIEFIFKNFGKYKDNVNDYLMVRFHGGEPLIEFNLIEDIVKKINYRKKDKNFKFAITTNGTILDKDIILFLKNEIYDLTVSLDGNKKTQDTMRPFKDGNSSFEKVLKNAEILEREIGNIRIRMTYDSNTVYNLYDDIKFLIDEGFKYIVPASNNYDINWDEDDVECLKITIIKLREYIKARGTSNVHISLLEKPQYINKGKCNMGNKSINIYSNGDLYPCIASSGRKGFKMGNIFSGLDEDRRNKIIYESECERECACRGCSIYNYCDGSRCRIVNKLTTGDYFTPPAIHCAVENLKYSLNKYV